MPIFQSAKKELSILFLDKTHKNVCVNLLKILAIQSDLKHSQIVNHNCEFKYAFSWWVVTFHKKIVFLWAFARVQYIFFFLVLVSCCHISSNLMRFDHINIAVYTDRSSCQRSARCIILTTIHVFRFEFLWIVFFSCVFFSFVNLSC